MRADGLPYIPPCPVCDTDTPRFMTIGLTHWAIRCRDKDCAFQIKHESEDRLRELWGRMQPAEPDPIAELEAMGGHIGSEGDILWAIRVDGIWWQEGIAEPTRTTDIRAAAARLLERIRGAK